jgi:molybdopterin-guanine dinucleotide biosynthesis protein A
MLARVVRVLRECVEPVVVVAAANQEVPPLPAEVLVARDEHEGLGPLAGLAAGLAALRPHVEAAYVSSCDVPLLQPAFVRQMVELLGSHELAIPRDGEYHHPLAAVYRTDLEDRVRGLLAESRLRPFFLVEQSRSQIVDVEDLRIVDPDLWSLRNVNTEKEYFHALAEAELDSPNDLPWPKPAP